VSTILVGISRPNLNRTGDYTRSECTKGWFIHAYNGALYGNGKLNSEGAGEYKTVWVCCSTLTTAPSASSRTAYSMGLAMQRAA
jgi:hypothetical protein